MSSAKDTLAKIKQNQDRYKAKRQASQSLHLENSGEGLDKRLAQAGINTSNSAQVQTANDILARLKNQSTTSTQKDVVTY